MENCLLTNVVGCDHAVVGGKIVYFRYKYGNPLDSCVFAYWNLFGCNTVERLAKTQKWYATINLKKRGDVNEDLKTFKLMDIDKYHQLKNNTWIWIREV